MSTFQIQVKDALGVAWSRKEWFKVSVGIRSVIFVSLLVASVAPVFGLYKWMEKSAIQKEIRYVEENHLIIAKNLSTAMGRYAIDVASVVALVSDSLSQSVDLDFKR